MKKLSLIKFEKNFSIAKIEKMHSRALTHGQPYISQNSHRAWV